MGILTGMVKQPTSPAKPDSHLKVMKADKRVMIVRRQPASRSEAETTPDPETAPDSESTTDPETAPDPAVTPAS